MEDAKALTLLRDTMGKASTASPAREDPAAPMFRRPFLLLAVILLGLVSIGLLAVGAFPPSVSPTPVERVVPNDRFQTR